MRPPPVKIVWSTQQFMGTGPKIFLGILGTLVVLIIGMPIVVGLAKGGVGAPAGPPPPYWNNANLAGTTWMVNTEVGEATVSFKPGGQVQVRHPLLQQFAGVAYVDGTWSISGDKLSLHAMAPPPLNKSIDYVATIEEKTIYGTDPDGKRLEARQLN